MPSAVSDLNGARVAGHHHNIIQLWYLEREDRGDPHGVEGTRPRGRGAKERVNVTANVIMGLPSSARSPMRFAEALRNEATAKTVRPTGVPEKGPATVRARPAVLPTKERMRMVFAFMPSDGLSTDRSQLEPVPSCRFLERVVLSDRCFDH